MTKPRPDEATLRNFTLGKLDPEQMAWVVEWMSENPDAYELAGEPFDADTKVGIALRKDSTALKAKLEEAMQALVKDGTYAALLKKWNLPPKASMF